MQRSRPTEGELRFELLAEIAVGATARVELCRVTEGPREGELIAVKRLHPHIAEDPQFVDMFRDEVWMTAALKHKHVVEVVGWGQDNEGPWLAVEFVRGVSLQRLMKTVFETGERFTERMVVFLARSICDGLATAHSLRSADGEHLNLVHRDLTPGNILLGFDGQVKITDFGLAKAKQRLTKTLTGLLKGQPQYMSPEQVQGQTLDARSDIFAMGVVAFELFSGRRPWTAQTDLDAMRAITDEPAADLQTLRPRIDRALVDIVKHCLEKAPAERFQSAFELRDRFDQWLIAHGYRDDNHSSLARFVRRNAMRQMRWFERAVAGEFADRARSERLPTSLPASRLPTRNEPADYPAAMKSTSTQPTVRATPISRAPRRAPLDSAAPTPRPGERPGERNPDDERSSIDWGEDGPTLIKRAQAAREALDRSLAKLPPPRAPDPSGTGELSTLRRQLPRSGRAQPPRSRRSVGSRGSEDMSTDADLGRRIVDAAAAAHAEHHLASADDTVQLNEEQREVLRALDGDDMESQHLGVVAPPDPDVPPLPPERAEELTLPLNDTVPEGTLGVPDDDSADGTIRRVRPPGLSPDGTITRAQPPPAPDRTRLAAADSTITHARPPPDAHPPPPEMPQVSHQDRYHERSSDFAAEAQRLGGEARAANEHARRASDIAHAAARAAGLAGEALRLAARGERHEAIQILREAQLVDEVLKRGVIPARMARRPQPQELSTRLRALGEAWLGFLASREGATILVIAALGLLVTVLFVVWLV